MLCYEDNSTNRAEESLRHFKEIANSVWFSETPMVLLLTRADILQRTLRRCPFSSVFSDYTGDDLDYEAVVTFTIAKYMSQYEGDRKHRIFPLWLII